MQLKVENRNIMVVINLLSNLSLKGKESRHRSKIVKVLKVRAQELAEEETELIKEHCQLDENEQPMKKDDGKSWDIKDMDAFVKDMNDMHQEEFIIDDTNLQEALKTVGSVLLNSDQKWSGQEAELYDELCEQFEEQGLSV